MEQLRPELPIQNIPLQLINIPEIPLEQQGSAQSHTKEFSIGEMKEEPGKIKIDFLAGDNPNKFITQPTEPAKPVVPGSQTTFINPSTNPGTASNPLNVQKSKEEIRGSMNTLISVLDYGISYLGMYIAGEGTQTQYTADTTQKKLLSDALTDFFYEKQIKMSPFFALVLAFLGAYGFMLIKAGKTRIDKKKGKVEPVKNTSSLSPVTEKIPVKENVFNSIQKFEKVEAITDIKQTFKWLNPDDKIIAASNQDIESYVKRGIYPMYIKSKKTGKTRKIKYIPETGQPVIIGKPARL